MKMACIDKHLSIISHMQIEKNKRMVIEIILLIFRLCTKFFQVTEMVK